MGIFSTIKSKIAIVLIISLSSLCLYFYFSSVSKDDTIALQRSEIAALQDAFFREKQRADILEDLGKEADNISVDGRRKTDALRNTAQNIVKDLDTRGKSNAEAGNSIPLDANVVRMLSELCETVRGESCPNP